MVVSTIHDVDPTSLAGVDLLVVGGPTHVRGMSRDSTRVAAGKAIENDPGLSLDRDTAGEGVREWLDRLTADVAGAAAFDTRVDMSPVLTGRASKDIAKLLRRHGVELVTDPESFLVTTQTQLLPTERDRAVQWGRELGASLTVA